MENKLRREFIGFKQLEGLENKLLRFQFFQQQELEASLGMLQWKRSLSR